MEKVLKVQLIDQNHSSGRGIGVYTEHLKSAFQNNKSIKLVQRDPDIIHYPFFDLFYHTLKLPKTDTPIVVTIHDITPLVMPDRYPKGIRGSINLFRQWLSLRKVNAIITDSECSKADIQKHFHISASKIHVVPLAVADIYKTKASSKQLELVQKKYQLPKKFVLTVAGGPNPNKNLPMIAEVTERLEIPLVLVGSGLTKEVVRPVHPELIDLVRLEVYPHLIRTGYVPDEDLLAMYQLCSLYVQPSLYEGFGIPLLEAMSSGCLIASSRKSSLPEIYYDEAITFNPKSVTSMEKAVSLGLGLSPAKKMNHIKWGVDRARDFSWQKTATDTLSVYKKII